MNNPPNPDGDLHTEAMILYHSIQLAAIEEMLAKVGDAVLRFPDSKNAVTFLKNLRQKNIENILRHQADTDPTRASRLREMLDKMNRGEQP